MNKTIRTFAAAVAAIMVLSLAGCGGGTAPAPAEKTSDTVQWFNNTYAVLTTANGQDVTLVGGMKPGVTAKASAIASLKESWDVTDKASAEETIDWPIEEGGHRAEFISDMEYLEELEVTTLSDEEILGAMTEVFEMSDEEAACYLASIRVYQARGKEAIDAWDYCRAMSLLGWYYLADYYTLEETLAKSLELGKAMQGMYGSWDEMVESYLDGYCYWAGEDPADPESYTAQRRKIYEELKAEENSCFNVAWNTELKLEG